MPSGRLKCGNEVMVESGGGGGGRQRRRKASSLMVGSGGGGGVAEAEEGEGNNLLMEALTKAQSVDLGNGAQSPIDNVRRLLESVGCCETNSSVTMLSPAHRPALFCEMLYLNTELAERVAAGDETGDEAPGSAGGAGGQSEMPNLQQTLFWQQTNRWIKFEQCVEGAGTRFSKPHVTLLAMYPLLQLKHCLRHGTMLLECGAPSFVRLCDQLVAEWTREGELEEELGNLVRDILYAPKLHLVQGKLRKLNETTGNDHFRRASCATDSIHSAAGARLSSDSSESVPEGALREDTDERLLKKLPPNIESAVILVANVGALERPLSAFVRLKYPTLLYPEMPDHRIPVRFVYILLNSVDNYPNETMGLGRTIGALLSDEIFQSVALHCLERHTLADAVDEFISQMVAIPPGNCTTEARWTPDEQGAGAAAVRHVGMLYANYSADDLAAAIDPASGPPEAHSGLPDHPYRTGTLFGGLVNDIRRKLPWFVSDFTDFFRGRLSPSLAASVLLFFANLSNIITFGAIMERSLHHQMASIENIICGAISGVLFGLLSGQPLNILSATGPTLIFEKILFDFCTTNHWDFLPFRFWVGAWMCLFLLILVATDASALVALITRFTEEAFATLISVVFIIQAFEKLFEISYEAPITRQPQEVLHSACYCIIQTEEWNSTVYKNLSVGVARCHELGGEPQGLQCYFKPDVYMFSILLTFGTFLTAYSLNQFRRSRYFSFRFRNLISDFGVLIAIVSFTLLTYLIGLEVPSLKVPASVRPTMDREWMVDFTNIEGYHVALIASFPALFYTILVVMDQQITAVIVNRKDNKLKKGGGYHLDLLVVSVLVLICSLFGLPFYVAATVLSVMHVESLKQYMDCSVPGERQRLLGVKEQRVSTIFAHILIGCSVFLTPLVKVVPLPVLTGIFFYMGVISLIGQQFVQRIALLFMPVKYQPDYAWLRNVPIGRVHTFTSIQLLSIGALFAIKYSSSTLSMMFPLMLIFTVLIRMLLLSRMFSPKELRALDDELPQFGEVIRGRRSKKAPSLHHAPMVPSSKANGRGGGGMEEEEEPLKRKKKGNNTGEDGGEEDGR